MPVTTSEFISGFSPQNIPGLTIWLDAADSNTVTQSGGVVSYWRDKSPNGIDVSQNTVAARPTYESNVQNGRPSLRFTTAQAMRSFSSFTLPPDQTWFVSYRTFAVGGKFFLEQGPDAGSTDGTYFFGGNSDLFAIRRASGGLRTFFDTTGALADGTWYIASLVNSNVSTATTDIVWNVNGTARGIAFRTNPLLSGNATNVLNINVRVPSSNYMGEILVYNRALSRGEVQLMERYLANKWGISLPTAHPYRTVPASLRPFNPLDIPGCGLWLDAADFQTLTLSGSNVTAWRDKSGNGNNATASVAAVYSNGGVYFNNSYYTTNYTASPTFETSFIVFNKPSVADAITNTLIGSTTGGREIGIGTNPSSGLGQYTIMNAATAFGGTSGPGTVLANTRAIGVATVNSGSTAVALNGGFFSPRVNLSFTAGRLTQLGRENGTSFGYVGFAFEILFYNSILSTQQRQQVELYLAQKWGLRSLLPIPLTPTITPAFNPTTISNCILWLDAADSASFTLSGTTLTSITDKSPTARMVTINSAPTYSSNTFNNRPGFVFASGNRLSAPTTALGTTMTLIGVYRATGGGSFGNATVIAVGFSQSGNETGIGYNAGGFYNIYDFGFGESSNRTFTTNNVNVLHVGVKTSSNVTSFINGTSALSANSTYSNANTTINIGEGGFRFIGSLAEALIYSRAITTTERQQIELYLAQKWGVNITFATTESPLRLYSSLAPVFNPTVIPGCGLWLDAADFQTLTLSGSNVTTWRDKSGNGNNATGGVSPTYSNSAVVFNGSTQYLTTTYSASLQNETIFVVSYLSTNSYANFPTMLASSGNGGRQIFVFNNGGFQVNVQLVTNGPNTGSNTVPTLQNVLFTYVCSSGSPSNSINLFVNASHLRVNASLGPFTSGFTTWVGQWPGGNNWQGNILEVVCYPSVLTTSQRQQVEGYLAWKWGLINNLPSTHPYRTIRI